MRCFKPLAPKIAGFTRGWDIGKENTSRKMLGETTGEGLKASGSFLAGRGLRIRRKKGKRRRGGGGVDGVAIGKIRRIKPAHALLLASDEGTGGLPRGGLNPLEKRR